MTTVKLKKLTPILWTKNLQETIAFYVDLLGFTCRYHDERFAALAKDDIEIMTIIPVDDSDSCKVSENEEEFFPKSYFTGSSIYIDTENVDELWEQIKDKVNVKYEIGNQEWLVRDFSILDNNGYEIVFGQERTVNRSEIPHYAHT